MNRPLLFMLLMLLLQSLAQADERILSFHSEITILPDSSMKVVETIRVRSEQDRIQRGIFRDFPTTYEDSYGNRYRVEFEIQSVQRDGLSENYFSQPQANGIRIYFGRQAVVLPRGEYTYTFTYTTSRQLGFFDDYDQLYWNVTGNGWEFPIDQASARVHLPDMVPVSSVTTTAYTGLQGSALQHYREDRFRGGTVLIEATMPLGPQQGLTIVVNWPKGFITEPSLTQKLGYFYGDNRHLVTGMAGLLVVLAYYLFSWGRVGKDPDSGVIITHYQPPDNYSPASLRFIENMGYDQTCFAVAIINLAVKGYLKILDEDGVYTLELTGKEVSMAKGEAALVKGLFSGSNRRVLKQASHPWIRAAMQAHEAALERDYEVNYFNTNSRYFIAGLVLTITVFILAILFMPDQSMIGGGIFMIVWLSIWSTAVFTLIRMAVQAWRRISGPSSIFAAIYATVFALIFAGAEVIALTAFGAIISWPMIVLILIGVGINWVFYEWLKAPTLRGRVLLDKVEGFRHYIEVAEKQELASRHPHCRSPELFETYLPYALALGVEQRWAEKFADVLTKVTSTGTAAYHPFWYSGSGWDNNHIGGFTSSLGSSFTNAIASSSTAPGSSSGGGGGGGGGGSSGGGGGGGGGGGW